MSRDLMRPDDEPFIALVDKTARVMRNDMLANAHRAGYAEIAPAHNAVFATLPPEGARSADMAARAGITRQSMGEVVRDMVRLGILEMVPDPSDRRAKIVTYTDYGTKVAQAGLDHIVALDRKLRDELGDDYDAARRVLARVREMLTP
ncbi:winged helix-turn-helix transcriptional regulator [Nocardioides albidus]|uniref:Winged helix-turn-helix transcriptional regulator n=1 Tax=Nocardioides albidus TaxID=1517589 RepID=A0A5C4VKF9_9ACTN|nr:MarR family winged helix-turn-helix transcriptional regulator [Nocardioides albidus]TNM36307.1 winged helix-turn-helix transcriptional regulator [Nocardioides albidus]